MRYKIGEVSKFLNLSDQMIRYYEKCGVIEPKRGGDGQYRYYTDMEVFQIFDAMRYKEWDINIKDIKWIIEDHYFERLLKKIDDFKHKLSTEIDYKSLLYSRISEMETQISLGRYNIGNYWIEEVPAQCRIFSGVAYGDQYSIAEEDVSFAHVVYEPDNISFFDILVEFSEESFSQDKEFWWYMTEEKYYEALDIKAECSRIPCQYCACTVIDMGEVGEFKAACVEPLMTYAQERGLAKTGLPYGTILGRGKDNGRFCRLMKLYLPVRTL